MFIVKTTKEFDKWIDGIADSITQLRLKRRLEKAQGGNLGDTKVLRDGVWEMKEDFGGGWRMYYVKKGNTLIVMLGGGNKSTQSKDLDRAIKLASKLEK